MHSLRIFSLKYTYSGKSKIDGEPPWIMNVNIPIEVPDEWAEFKEKQPEFWLNMVIITEKLN